MVGPVNLNQFRKAKARAEASTRADENVIKHGRTKAQKALEKARAKKQCLTLDQHKSEQ